MIILPILAESILLVSNPKTYKSNTIIPADIINENKINNILLVNVLDTPVDNGFTNKYS